MAFELDSPERESGEGSTTPCGVKGVVGPGSRAQIRLAVEKTECPLQRTTTQVENRTPKPTEPSAHLRSSVGWVLGY